jgi:hypothetical protein
VQSPVKGVYGHFGAPNLVNWLYHRGAHTKTFPKMTEAQAKEELASLKKGDVIAYFRTAKQQYQHCALYLGDETIACHTVCRFGKPWNLPGFLYTFIHIKDRPA